jgi:hypothetical protein
MQSERPIAVAVVAIFDMAEILFALTRANSPSARFVPAMLQCTDIAAMHPASQLRQARGGTRVDMCAINDLR